MEITDHISANLSAWMDSTPSLGTLKKVAAKAGICFGTVRRAKNGDGNTTIKNLTAIARAFNRSIEYLLRAPANYAKGGMVTDFPARQAVVPPLISELTEIADSMSDRGQAELIGRAKELALRHPRAKGNRVSS